MPKMRLGWYAGVSTALAGAVVLSAFHQRANFYSAMVYLAQSNFCLLALVNFTLLLYSSFVYGLTRLCFGSLRAIEVEQLTERAWFAITETCLAMTIFRDEIGAWFLVMFTALVTGKVWGWIGDGRVEFLEQQPPTNPRLFHLRLSVSLAVSFLYDVWILHYTINSVIQQARPNMMVMFLFEFAVLATCSWRTGARYLLSLAEQNIVQTQTRKRLLERKLEVRQQRQDMIRERQRAAAAGEEVENQEPLPSEDDIDEMDIEVPGWSAKGEWVLWLDLVTDMIKLGIYVAFFFMLLTFYGLPIHIMRDLFMTSRDFVKRLNALLRYRRAIHEMNRHPDATVEDLAQENTCIICREEMHIWDPTNNPAALDRVRPKKLPCGHILHLGCLKSWLERQQVCPTCRAPVSGERARPQNRAAGLRIQIGGGAAPQVQGQQPQNDGGAPRQDGGAQQQPQGRGPRVFNLGPIRLGFGGNGQQVRQLVEQFGAPQMPGHQGVTPTPTVPLTQAQTGDSIAQLLQQAEQMVVRELQNLQTTQQELQTIQLLSLELQRIRLRRLQPQDQGQNGQIPPAVSPHLPVTNNGAFPMPPFPMPTPGQVPVFPGMGSLGIPPRVSTPFMARHTSPGSAIPAGSPELPEGVVIPAGWSLMPLQRLDGAQNTGQHSPQTAGPSSQTNTETANEQRAAVTATQLVPAGPSSNAVAAGEAHPQTTSQEPRSAEAPASTNLPARPAEPPSVPAAVVAPSPVLPNWGGQAQLFSGLQRHDAPENGSSTHRNGAQESTDQQSDSGSSSAQRQSDEQDSDQDSDEEGPSDKGKGKAVTVEEAEDDQDEED